MGKIGRSMGDRVVNRGISNLAGVVAVSNDSPLVIS